MNRKWNHPSKNIRIACRAELTEFMLKMSSKSTTKRKWRTLKFIFAPCEQARTREQCHLIIREYLYQKQSAQLMFKLRLELPNNTNSKCIKVSAILKGINLKTNIFF